MACYMRKRLDKNPDARAKARASTRRWQEKNYSQSYFLKREWGLSQEDFEKMLREQDGGCAICRRPLADIRGRRLHVDHDHKSGAVRGLLCFRCNTCLGQFEDSAILLESAISYLGKFAHLDKLS